MAEKWMSALVALESNPPSQERAWLFKNEPNHWWPNKSRSEIVAGVKPRDPV